MSGDRGLPESCLTIEELEELSDKELFAILGVKEIMSRAYRKVSPEECVSAPDYMTNEEKSKFKAILEKNIKSYLMIDLVYTLTKSSS